MLRNKKKKKKDNNDDKMGVNKEKSAKMHFSVNAFIIKRFPLPYVTFSKTRQSIVRFINKDL